jgi:hypothetical protein
LLAGVVLPWSASIWAQQHLRIAPNRDAADGEPA